MARKRGNPFTGDAPASKKAWSHGTLEGHSSVYVEAHTRKKPVKTARGVAEREHPAIAQTIREDVVDNKFDNQFDEPSGPQSTSGLQRPGEPQVNHLKAAIGLINRKRV